MANLGSQKSLFGTLPLSPSCGNTALGVLSITDMVPFFTLMEFAWYVVTVDSVRKCVALLSYVVIKSDTLPSLSVCVGVCVFVCLRVCVCVCVSVSVCVHFISSSYLFIFIVANTQAK